MARSTYPRRAAVIAVALLGVLLFLDPAWASLRGDATATESVASGTFAVVPTVLGTTPPPGPLVLTYAAVLSPPAQYFDAVNTGSIALVGASYAVGLTSLVSIGTNSLTLTACVGGTWNQAAGTCSGTTQSLGSWTSASSAAVASAYAPTSSGSRLGVKATLSSGVLTAVTVATISVSVSSGPTRQIRVAQTNNG
ncbi:MAG: hypothetical protein ABIO67_07660 [Mycobacteriales bacterium]